MKKRVAQIMLQCGRNRDGSLLKTAHHRFAHVSHELDILAKRLPKPRPTRIPAHVQHGSEIPRNATCFDFAGRAFRHFPHQRRVPSCGQCNLLRAQCCSGSVGRAVNGVHTVQGGHTLGLNARGLNARNQFPPLRSRVSMPPAIQHAARKLQSPRREDMFAPVRARRARERLSSE